MKKTKKWTLPGLLILSIIFHTIVLNISSFPQISLTPSAEKSALKLRIVGEEKGKEKNLIYLEEANKNNTQKTKKPSLKQLAFKELPIQQKSAQNNPATLKSLDINNEKVKSFLKTPSPGSLSAGQALQAMSDTDIDIKLEVPKGVKEDELNKKELVFYSFQKRTVLAYVNSFQKELNDFERSHPHLRFPLTNDEQKLAGRVIYDKNGDILKIETLQWSQIEKLQTFFMRVLQNMSSLPNPPDEILDNDKFAINFVLTINNQSLR
ncbi:MAG: hypothetical protein QF441_06930 [Bacteriovoracaceae bacterium]|jgi:hypothetical protein|nr:hypothetical protein [Bacteriovoracaceae bacterium]